MFDGRSCRIYDDVRDSRIRKDVSSKLNHGSDSFLQGSIQVSTELRHHRKLGLHHVGRDFPRSTVDEINRRFNHQNNNMKGEVDFGRRQSGRVFPRTKVGEHSQLPNLTVDLPDFYGSSRMMEVWNWVDSVDDYFKENSYPEHIRYKVAACKLKGDARVWLEILQSDRISDGVNQINSWSELSELLICRYPHTTCLSENCNQRTKHAKGKDAWKHRDSHTDCSIKVPIDSSSSKRGPIQADLSVHKFKDDEPAKENVYNITPTKCSTKCSLEVDLCSDVVKCEHNVSEIHVKQIYGHSQEMREVKPKPACLDTIVDLDANNLRPKRIPLLACSSVLNSEFDQTPMRDSQMEVNRNAPSIVKHNVIPTEIVEHIGPENVNKVYWMTPEAIPFSLYDHKATLEKYIQPFVDQRCKLVAIDGVRNEMDRFWVSLHWLRAMVVVLFDPGGSCKDKLHWFLQDACLMHNMSLNRGSMNMVKVNRAGTTALKAFDKGPWPKLTAYESQKNIDEITALKAWAWNDGEPFVLPNIISSVNKHMPFLINLCGLLYPIEAWSINLMSLILVRIGDLNSEKCSNDINQQAINSEKVVQLLSFKSLSASCFGQMIGQTRWSSNDVGILVDEMVSLSFDPGGVTKRENTFASLICIVETADLSSPIVRKKRMIDGEYMAYTSSIVKFVTFLFDPGGCPVCQTYGSISSLCLYVEIRMHFFGQYDESFAAAIFQCPVSQLQSLFHKVQPDAIIGELEMFLIDPGGCRSISTWGFIVRLWPGAFLPQLDHQAIVVSSSSRGRVVPWEGWNDVKNHNKEDMFAMAKICSVILSIRLSILGKCGYLWKSSRFFLKMVYGLDPPTYMTVKLDGCGMDSKVRSWTSFSCGGWTDVGTSKPVSKSVSYYIIILSSY